MKRQYIFIVLAIIVGSGIFIVGMERSTSIERKITIGMIGKIAANPVFQAAYAGARMAAKELGAQYNVEIVIDWQTPQVNNSKEQIALIEKLARKGVDGIAIASSDATQLTPIINKVVGQGIPTMCFISDAPKSKRFAYEGVDDIEFGRSIMRELAQEMEEKGIVAVLAGSQGALNQELRLQGIKEELKKYPGLSLSTKNCYHHQETPSKAVETIRKAQKANPNIGGWAFLGSWALLEKNSLPWAPGEVKVVAGYAVPEELEYIRSGHVQALIGVNCFQSGYKSVELLIDKIMNNREPANPAIFCKLVRVSKSNLNEWLLNWNKWLVKEAVSR